MIRTLKMLPIGVIFGFALSVQAWSDQNTEDLFSITLGELSQIVITGATMHDESLRPRLLFTREKKFGI